MRSDLNEQFVWKGFHVDVKVWFEVFVNAGVRPEIGVVCGQIRIS